MAYAPMPKLVSIHAPKIGCNQLSMDTLTEILQSESVQRLLNRQNVYLQTPLTDGSVVSDLASSKNSIGEGRNVSADSDKSEKIPELSVIPIAVPLDKAAARESSDDEHLLPSKNQGKSSVALLPINREKRDCGHSEACERIICEVEFQPCFEDDDFFPLIAENIEFEDIDAPVYKHCESDMCDATSIDHDRCRRAIVRCYRSDKTNKCDICMTTLKTRKSQMKHKNCKIRNEYRHNRTSRAKLMRDRMRMRELEILESSRLNRNDYMNPETGHARAMENLQRNSELIVIPRGTTAIKQSHPTIRITSVSGGTNYRPSGITSGKTSTRYSPLVFPASTMLLAKRANSDVTEKTPKRLNIVNGKFASSTPVKRGQFISISRNLTQSLDTNNLTQQSESQNSTNLQNQTTTSYFMPIRVVPISTLKNESPLRRKSQGVPKFCIVSTQATNQTSTPSAALTFARTPKRILPAQTKETATTFVVGKSATSSPSSMNDKTSSKGDGEFVIKRFKQGMRRGRRRKNGPKRGSKSFECSFCFKRFSTDWYFKLHIAKHKGEIKYTCEYCNKPFMNFFNMTKHKVAVHNVREENGQMKNNEKNGEIAEAEEVEEGEEEDDEDDDDDDDSRRYFNCSGCSLSFETITERESHRCPVICLLCHAIIPDGDLLHHIRMNHEMNENEATEEFDRQKKQRASIANNSGTERQENVIESEIFIKEEPGEINYEANNDSFKRTKNLTIPNNSKEQNAIKTIGRRRKRRRKRIHVERADSVGMKKKRPDGHEELSYVELPQSPSAIMTDPISR